MKPNTVTRPPVFLDQNVELIDKDATGTVLEVGDYSFLSILGQIISQIIFLFHNSAGSHDQPGHFKSRTPTLGYTR